MARASSADRGWALAPLEAIVATVPISAIAAKIGVRRVIASLRNAHCALNWFVENLQQE
jgi:hypothetical protein